MTYIPGLTSSTPSGARSTVKQSTNSSGATLAKCLPVRITATGLNTINPSIESEVDALLGITQQSIANGSAGEVATSGIIENCGLAFLVGDILYLSKSGGIINTKPSIGLYGFVAGDFVVRLGVMVKNNDVPSQLDMLVNINFVGQL